VPARDGRLLLPYQTKWVRDTSRLKIAEKSRQIGWTWATACGLVRRKGLFDEACDAWISSRDQLQSQLFIEDCKHFADYFSIAADVFAIDLLTPKGATDHGLKFANGRRIHSLSSNPDAQAGKRGDRILDEFALHEDPRKLFSIALPGISWAGSLEIFSTHRGTQNYFNELINEIKHGGNPKGFSLHSVSLQTALEQGLLHKLQAKLPEGDPRLEMDEAEYFDSIRRTCADEESFQEEFCCQPSDEQTAFLSYDLIGSCEFKAGESWQVNLAPQSDMGRRSFYAGVDIGRDHDLTVIWVVERVGDVRFTREVMALERATFEAQESALYGILRNGAVKRCCIDQTGIGRQFVERAQKKFGMYRVEGLHFTGAVKEELAYPVRAAFEDRTVRVPRSAEIRADLRSVRKEATASGNVRFAGERTRNGHADRFWALALALHASKEADGGQYWAQVVR
jgi:phage FluMu gp28-like protein